MVGGDLLILSQGVNSLDRESQDLVVCGGVFFV